MESSSFNTTKAMKDFPEICVSTFSKNIIQKFASLSNTKKIAALYTANGVIPVYKIFYKDRDIIIIPVSAIRDEGTSYHYIAPSVEIEANEHSIRILENVLKSCGYSYVKGKTWTSDAIYRETIPAIYERRQEGCLVVEMECASMLAVSQYRRIPFIQFLYGADNLSSDKWEIRDLELYGFTNAEKYMLLAFECALSM